MKDMIETIAFLLENGDFIGADGNDYRLEETGSGLKVIRNNDTICELTLKGA